MSFSKIEWTDATWNPVTGCSKISSGCMHCYAERLATRLKAMGQRNYRHGFEVSCHEQMLDRPLRWRKPRTVFVNSMSDLFHEEVPDEFVKQVFEVMKMASWHTFQVLTKRTSRMESLSRVLPWPDNVWLGVTVESSNYLDRIDSLLRVPAKVRFLSMEPLLSGVTIRGIKELDWVIVGGESGPGARPMEGDWVEDIRLQCQENDTPFFFKQWGGVNKKAAGRLLGGRTYDEVPPYTRNAHCQ